MKANIGWNCFLKLDTSLMIHIKQFEMNVALFGEC